MPLSIFSVLQPHVPNVSSCHTEGGSTPNDLTFSYNLQSSFSTEGHMLRYRSLDSKAPFHEKHNPIYNRGHCINVLGGGNCFSVGLRKGHRESGREPIYQCPAPSHLYLLPNNTVTALLVLNLPQLSLPSRCHTAAGVNFSIRAQI